jgi:hypothetical protein
MNESGYLVHARRCALDQARVDLIAVDRFLEIQPRRPALEQSRERLNHVGRRRRTFSNRRRTSHDQCLPLRNELTQLVLQARNKCKRDFIEA